MSELTIYWTTEIKYSFHDSFNSLAHLQYFCICSHMSAIAKHCHIIIYNYYVYNINLLLLSLRLSFSHFPPFSSCRCTIQHKLLVITVVPVVLDVTFGFPFVNQWMFVFSLYLHRNWFSNFMGGTHVAVHWTHELPGGNWYASTEHLW